MWDIFYERDILNCLQYQISVAVLFFVGWIAYFALVRLVYKQGKDVSEKVYEDNVNRIVSLTHGILSFWLAVFCFFPDPNFKYPQFYHSQLNTAAQTYVVLNSLAYSFYDLLASMYYGLYDAGLILHHLFCLGGFGTGAFTGYGAIDGIGGLVFAEASNFPMHMRMIVRNYNLRYTKLYEFF